MPVSILADPYATKGLEYLLVLAFLPLLVWFWRVVRQPGRATVPAGGGESAWFQLPDHVYYHPGHSWALPGDGDRVRIGMDDFAQKLIGAAQGIELPKPGDQLVQGGRAWRVRVDSKAVEVLSPVDGVVVARNDRVLRSPELVNQDPYGRGWLLEVETSRMAPNLRTLLHGDVARAWMDATLGTLRRQMTPELGAVMQDGGVPVDGIARALSPELWHEIASDFLLSR